MARLSANGARFTPDATKPTAPEWLLTVNDLSWLEKIMIVGRHGVERETIPAETIVDADVKQPSQ